MNTFMNTFNNINNYSYTENGALTHCFTNNKVYDMFAFGGAYRTRKDSDCILLFKNAFEENHDLALKCLFYLRDCRGGQGERRFFRICFKWLAKEYPLIADKLIKYIPFYGRWDDLFELFNTPCENHVIELIIEQLTCDMACEKNGVSLCAKWCPSENASSLKTKEKAKKLRQAMLLSSRQYRKMLSKLREKINVLERLMSSNQWDKIEFDKIPSKAGLIYKNAFAKRDIIAEKYKAFAKNKDTKVNANTLYPYEIVDKALKYNGKEKDLFDDPSRLMINKYWSCQPNYFENQNSSMMCVVDTSGSMTGFSRYSAFAPINVAIGLGMYCAERCNGPFKNHYISFASRPQLIKIEGIDFVDKVKRIYGTNLCDNTNLEAVFNLLLNIAKRPEVKREDIPKTIVVISDMEIDAGTNDWRYSSGWNKKTAQTEMEKIRSRWAAAGYELPHLIYWNVEARHNNILDSGPNVTFVSGSSPTIFKQVITGKSGYDLMIETICADRYKDIRA